MIQVNNLKKEFGGQVLFEQSSLMINPRERVGLIGRNGSGKSTFFKMILGELACDAGEIIVPKGYKIGALSQHIRFSESTVIEECLKGLSPEERLEQHKAEKILFGLGFSKADMERDPLSFSGGYQVRLNLARALLGEPHLLLLDEPTNYLDIVSLRWLQSFLKSFDGEVLLITHDRHFMDQVVTHTIGITRKRLRKIKGGTQKYYELIAAEEELHENTRANQEKKRKEMLAFVERFGAKATKATQAQSRIKQLEKMEVLDELTNERNLSFQFRLQECPGKNILELNNLSFAYPDGPVLFSDLNLTIGRHDRVAVIGKNGKGKSTLLNVLAGDFNAKTGEIKFHPAMSLGHFGQTNVERLNLNLTIEEEIYQSNTELSRTEVRSLAGLMMFEGDLAQKKIRVLSGGEKSRVLLAKMLGKKTNLLFLDEPTNHLDMESVEALTVAIEKYKGALLLVTHSEEMIARLATKLIVFQAGRAQVFDGTYHEFLEKVGWEEESGSPRKKTPEKNAPSKDQSTQQRSQELKSLREKMTSIEEVIIKLEELLKLKENQLSEASAKGESGEKIAELSRSFGELTQKVEALYDELEKVAVQIEEREGL